MAEEGVLVYGGREYRANDPFLAGQFPFLFQSTSSLGGILKAAEFEVGTAFLPRLGDEYGGRQQRCRRRLSLDHGHGARRNSSRPPGSS